MAEILLRMFQPFPARIRGDKIVLPCNLQRQVVLDNPIPGLDREFTHTVNSLGFRGPEPPSDLSDVLSIITVGGSTTECSLMDDAKTWPALLGKRFEKEYPDSWVNNAGMDGGASYGHVIFLNDYIVKLKPRMVLFLMGVNDMGRANYDAGAWFFHLDNDPLFRKFMKSSEIAAVIGNLIRAHKVKHVDLTYREHDPSSRPYRTDLADSIVAIDLGKHKPFLAIYEPRVEYLVAHCIKMGIQPVLITQPLLYPRGSIVDRRIELYNQVLRRVGDANGILVIDLARELSDDTLYYYDSGHFSVAGARKVSEIVAQSLINNSTLNRTYSSR